MGRPLGSRNKNGHHQQIIDLATGSEILSQRQIGERLGITPQAVALALKAEGIKKPPVPHHTNYLTGPAHPQWKGDGISTRWARYGSHKVIPKLGTCEQCGERPARERHHIDKNPRNNDLSNLQQLCALCHRKMHPQVRGEKVPATENQHGA